jgi:Zn-dependent M28 family amino/carboxypeptidase
VTPKYLFPLAAILAACSAEEPATTPAETAAFSQTIVEATGGNPAAEAAANAITDPYMREIIAEISSDEYEGRGPGSRGDEKTRKYLVGRMEELGLQPGGEDGSWEQPFELVGVNTIQPEAWVFEGHGKTKTLAQWDDYVVNSGKQQDRVDIEDAELVFVGYGIQAPEYGWDDFKGVDLEGKVLLMMNNDPDWDPELFAGDARLYYGRWTYKYESAARQGAAGAIIIHTTPSASYPFQVVQTSWTGPQFELRAGDEPRTDFNSWVTEDKARELVAMAGHDLDELRERAYNTDFEPVPLGITTSIGMDVELEYVETANILGLLPGSDPELKDEVVVYTAHHDHLGIGTPDENGDTIYNGAYDNASGVALVMGIGKAMMAMPEAPRRSVLIALVGAEEQGLLGSLYYARNPTFPAGKIAANINYDTVNIWGHSHDATYIGLGKTTIDHIVELIAAEQGRVIKPDQFPYKGSFYRSDQFSFARIGVPAAYLDPGTNFVDRPPGWGKEQVDHYTEVNYHQASDEYDPSWNLDGMITDAQLGFWVGLAVANTDEMPTWNAGDEFEATRLEALAGEEE